MKKNVYFLLLVFITTSAIKMQAQSVGDYRSAATGTWGTLGTWERFDGTTWATPTVGEGTPTNASGVITIQGTHNVTVASSVSIDQTTINSGGTITISSGQTLTVVDDGTSASDLVNTGTLTVTGSLIVASNAIYQHNIGTGLPIATWQDFSTCMVTGVVAQSSLSNTANQSFYHFTWNCAAQSNTMQLALVTTAAGTTTFRGNVNLINTNSGKIRFVSLAASDNKTVTINGDLNILGGTLETTGSGVVATVNVNVLGNLNISGGTLFLVASSASFNFNLAGNFNMSGGIINKGSGVGNFNFNKSGVQSFIKSAGTITNGGAGLIIFNVNSGAVLDFGTNVFNSTSNNVTFNVANGGGLKIGSPDGLVSTTGVSNTTSNIQLTGTTGVTKTFSSGGNYEFNGSTAQVTGTFTTTPTANTVNNLTISNVAGVSLSSAFTVTGTLSVASGTLTTGSNNLTIDNSTGSLVIGATGALSITGGTTDINNRNVTIRSTASGTGRIATITGDNVTTGLLDATNVTIERFIPGGSRRFRFISHPFNRDTSINIIRGIDYTGAGGMANGFSVNTVTNNPSVFWFNTANANGGSPTDAGWKAFTAANTSIDSNAFKVGQGIRILVRGAAGQGLDGNSYTARDTTISMTGTINTGNVNVPLVLGGSGGSANFNLVGNPYPSAVNIEDIITANTNVNKTIYLRNPSSGSYITKDLSLVANADYAIPSSTAFFVVPTAASNLTFTESNKVSTPTTDVVFTEKAKDPTAYIELQTLVGTEVYDNMYVKFDKKWSNTFENKVDATKAQNDFVNVYSISEEGKQLSVDGRPFIHQSQIPLGVRLNNGSRTLSIKASTVNIDETAYEVVLLDKLTNIKTVLSKEAEYSFIVNMSDATTYGDERLVLLLSKKATANPVDVATTSFGAKLQSTVISNKIAINLQNATGKTSIRVVNALGQTMVTREASNIGTGTVEIISDKLGKGLYYIQVENGNSKQTLTASKL